MTETMVSEIEPSNRVSLVSLDPTVASHITRGIEPLSESRSATHTSLTKRHKTSHKVGQSVNHTMPVGGKTQQKRANSSKRVKTGTDALRRRATKTKKPVEQVESISDTRGGRNFTVGNVGTGGTLYLRYELDGEDDRHLD